MLDVTLVPCLSDNYAYVLRDPATGECAVVDPSEAEPVLAALAYLAPPLGIRAAPRALAGVWPRPGVGARVGGATAILVMGTKSFTGS